MTNLTVPDFDALVALHAKDPGAYEALRIRLLQEYIIEAPDKYQPMLDALVWQIEQTRTTAATPVEAVTVAIKLMTSEVNRMTEMTSALIDAKLKI